MKNVFKLFGTIALCALVVFSMTACPDDGGGNGNGGGGYTVTGGGESAVTWTADQLTLAGKVFTEEYSEETGITYVEYNGSKTLYSIGGGSGDITDGMLNYTIGVPESYSNYWGLVFSSYEWTDVTLSEEVSFFDLNLSDLVNDPFNYDYTLSLIRINGSTYTSEYIQFIYVTEAVTISGKGRIEIYEEDGYTMESKDFEISLSEGWNALCFKSVYNASSDKDTRTVSKMTSIPSSVTWEIYKYEYEGPEVPEIPGEPEEEEIE